MSNRKLTVVPPTLPPAKIERTFAAFDRMVHLVDQFVGCRNEHDRASMALYRAMEPLRWIMTIDPKQFGNTPTLKNLTDLELALSDAKGLLERKTVGGIPLDKLDALAEKMRADVAFYEREELYDDFEERIISRTVVSEGVALVLGTYTHEKPNAPEVRSAMMIEEVIAYEPNPIVFESACRRARRTRKFPPSIAEFLDDLKAEDSAWCNRWDIAEGSADDGDLIEQWIKEARNELAEEIEEAKATFRDNFTLERDASGKPLSVKRKLKPVVP